MHQAAKKSRQKPDHLKDYHNNPDLVDKITTLTQKVASHRTGATIALLRPPLSKHQKQFRDQAFHQCQYHTNNPQVPKWSERNPETPSPVPALPCHLGSHVLGVCCLLFLCYDSHDFPTITIPVLSLICFRLDYHSR